MLAGVWTWVRLHRLHKYLRRQPLFVYIGIYYEKTFVFDRFRSLTFTLVACGKSSSKTETKGSMDNERLQRF